MPTRRFLALAIAASMFALFALLLAAFVAPFATAVAAQDAAPPAVNESVSVAPAGVAPAGVAPASVAAMDAHPNYRDSYIDGQLHYRCGIDKQRRVRCFGDNHAGQIGNGIANDTPVSTPVIVSQTKSPGVTLTDVRTLAVGDAAACAGTIAGDVYCWGLNWEPTPKLEPMFSGARALAARDGFLCALKQDNQIICHNPSYPGGYDGGPTFKQYDMGAVANVVKMRVSTYHGCVLDEKGDVYCFGCNYDSALGRGNNDEESFCDHVETDDQAAGRRVAKVVGLSNVIDLAVRGNGGCALKAGNEIWCWGSNGLPQFLMAGPGIGWSSATPVRALLNFAGLGNVVEIDNTSGSRICMRTDIGKVLCPRYDNSTSQTVLDDMAFSDLEDVTQLKLNLDHGCAATKTGGYYCHGTNQRGSLGLGHTNQVEGVHQVLGGDWVFTGGTQVVVKIVDEYRQTQNPQPAPPLVEGFVITRTDSIGEVITATVDASGVYTFAGVEAGNYIFEAESSRHDLVRPLGEDLLAAVLEVDEIGGTYVISFTAGLIPDNGMRPVPDGFVIQNYGGVFDPAVPELTTSTLFAMFGKSICAFGDTADDCTMWNAVEQWQATQRGIMNGGHCFGFATASQILYENRYPAPAMPFFVSRPVFGMTSTNVALREFIARQQVSLYLTLTSGEKSYLVDWKKGTTPNQVLELLRTELSKPEAERDPVQLSIVMEREGGHAVTPYRIVRTNPTTQRVYIYDSNFPGNDERYIVFNTAANTWLYAFAALNPEQPVGAWTGSAATDSLMVTKTSTFRKALTQKWRCDFCPPPLDEAQGADWTDAAGSGAQLTIASPSQSLLLVTKGDTQSGWKPGAGGGYINQIPEGTLLNPPTGTGVEVGAAVVVPAGTGYAFSLSSIVAQTLDSGLSILGPGYGAGITDLDLASGKQVAAELGDDGRTILFTAAETKVSPTLFVLDDTGAESYRVDLTVEGLAVGDQAALTPAADGGGWLLRIAKASGGSSQIFQSALIPADGSVKVVVDLAEWDGTGNLPTTIDGAPGSLPAASGSMWLPLVNGK